VNPPRLLLVSNGYGEIAILECVARAIAELAPDAVLAHLPLVGSLPADAWPKPLGPQAAMPSGGLVTYWNVRNLMRDLGAGLARTTLRQFGVLRRCRSEFDAVVAVGDIYCLAVCLVFAKLPAVFVATAKSEAVAPHSTLECAIARRAKITFARDADTAKALSKRGVHAVYAGNVMMDCVAPSQTSLTPDQNALPIAVLPGSRQDALGNAAAAARRLQRIARLSGKPVEAYLALAPSVDDGDVAATLANAGFALERTGQITGVVALARSGNVAIHLVRGATGDVLRAATIVLGQAGTGNEQAAGLGKPVIAATTAGESPQSVGWYRMRQQRLLGDALLVLPGDDDEIFARETLLLLEDPTRMTRMAQAGKDRMGGSGAAAAVARSALDVAMERS
jgi:tetraacyldisaccharide 4'-kinase